MTTNGKAATHLEGGWGPSEHEIAEVVASHYVAALEAAPDDEDAAEISAKARTMLSRAGERAASLAASEEARSERGSTLADGLYSAV